MLLNSIKDAIKDSMYHLHMFSGSLNELLALFKEPKGRRPLKPNANSTSSEIKKQVCSVCMIKS